jgi:hypothetical protein
MGPETARSCLAKDCMRNDLGAAIAEPIGFDIRQ